MGIRRLEDSELTSVHRIKEPQRLSQRRHHRHTRSISAILISGSLLALCCLCLQVVLVASLLLVATTAPHVAAQTIPEPTIVGWDCPNCGRYVAVEDSPCPEHYECPYCGWRDDAKGGGRSTTPTRPPPTPSLPFTELTRGAQRQRQEIFKRVMQFQGTFERDKQALPAAFEVPARELFDGSDSGTSRLGEGALVGEKPSFGVGPAPAEVVQQGGITEQEWQQARQWQQEIDALAGKWPLSQTENERLEELESKRNALWKRAVSTPGLTGEERQRLRLKLYTRTLTATTGSILSVTSDQRNLWTQSPPPPPMRADHLQPEYLGQWSWPL